MIFLPPQVKQTDQKIQVKSIFKRYLEEHGHRKTPERFAILDEIYDSTGHFDVDELYEQMKEKNYRVSRATLYNTIDLLLASNLIRKHQFGKNQAQFEPSFANRQHDHIIMTETGEVMEFCDPRLQLIKNSLEESLGIKILHHSLNFYAVKNEGGPNAE